MSDRPIPVAPGIHTFETGPFRWYIIEEDDRVTVVDAGLPGHLSLLERGLRMLDRSLRDIEGIVLTHAHADHMGFAEVLRRRLGVPVFVHREDAAAARRRLQLPLLGLLANAWRPAVVGMLGHAMRHGVFWVPPLRKVEGVSDGAVLDLPGHPRVMHTPGHTPGQISLFVEHRKVLIAGDTLVTRHLLTGREGTPVVPPPVLSHDHAQAVRSLDRLAKLGDVTLLTGHGPPWIGPMDEAVKNALQQL